jgi:histone H3/H4
MSTDIYEPIKELSGKFVHDVVADVAKNYETVTSLELEPVVTAYLGRKVEDLEKNEINATTFSRWLKGVTEENNVVLKREAALYLHNSVEFYILCLLVNAKDIARHSRRSRVTSEDVFMGARM